MILPDWMSEERPVVTKVGRNNFLIRNRHHLEALLQKFETHPLKVASVFHPTAKVLLLFFLLILFCSYSVTSGASVECDYNITTACFSFNTYDVYNSICT